MSWILGIDAVCRVSRLNIIALIFVCGSSVCVWEGVRRDFEYICTCASIHKKGGY